jgi:hypothetical protein
MHVVAVTRNESISATTLHTLMNINTFCLHQQIHATIHFVEDKASLPKLIKSGERIIWLDYGMNLDQDSIHKAVQPFDKGIQVLVFPAVLPGINWDKFKKGTDPVSQRGLTFDTEVGRKLADGLYECAKTNARVWAMDSKPVDKKTRGKTLPLDSNEALFGRLADLEVKIGVQSTASVTCTYIHESIGNILQSSGLKVT